MRITKIKYSKLFSLGNFQNEKIELEADIEHGDTEHEVFMVLRNSVEQLHIEGIREAEKSKRPATVNTSGDGLPF